MRYISVTCCKWVNHHIFPSFSSYVSLVPVPSILHRISILWISQLSIILANVVYYWTRSFIMFTFHLFFLFQRIWGQWEMRLWPVEWFTVSTAITQSPQPSTLLSIPRLDVHGTPTFSSPISAATTPWWTTTPEKECCMYAWDNRRFATYPITEIWETLSSLCDQQVLGFKNADQERFALRKRWQVRVVLGKRVLLLHKNKQTTEMPNKPTSIFSTLTLQKPTVNATSKQWIPKLIFSSLWLQYNL